MKWLNNVKSWGDCFVTPIFFRIFATDKKTKGMKSINEFATEYAQDKYLPVQTSQAVKVGANYVLEEIEDFMKHNLVCSSNLKRLIEELKK